MYRIGDVIPLETIMAVRSTVAQQALERSRRRREIEEAKRREIHDAITWREDAQRVIMLRHLFEQDDLAGEEAIEAQALIESLRDSQYVKRNQVLQLEILKWQQVLAQLLPPK